MIYKINIDKKQEVIKWNYKQTLKNLLPIIVPGFIIVNIIMLIFFPRKFQNIESLIPIIILGCNLIYIPICFSSIFLGAKKASKKMEVCELDINDNYAILKNSFETKTVNFADFKKFKKDDDSITFYFNRIKCFYINWNCFLDSEKLKKELEQVAEKIGTFKKENLSPEEQKTIMKSKAKFVLFIIVMLILLIIQIVSYLL